MTKKTFTKETFKRMWRTFFQAAASYITVNVAIIDFSETEDVIKSALIGLGVSALAAGFAAVMNLEKTNTIEGVESGVE